MGAMSGQARLSVVIPTHETHDLVLRCLESLDACSPISAGLEIIVVDDGSSDGSSESIKSRFPQVKLLKNEHAQGFSLAACSGLDMAGGDFLLLLNSDTRMRRGSLDALLKRLKHHSDLEIIGAQLLNPDGSGQWSGGAFPTPLWLFALVSGLGALRGEFLARSRPSSPRGAGASPVDWVSGAAMAFRREVWEQVGPFEHSFAFYAQDLDFCYRAHEAGINSVLLPEFRVFHEHGGTVRSREGAVDSVEPEKLWPDLLRFVRMHSNPRRADLIRHLMRCGALMRLAVRICRGRLMGARDRREWRRDTESFRRAAAQLSRNAASS